jgi:predicted metal-dependent peptidase
MAGELRRALHGHEAGMFAGEVAAAGAAEVGWEELLARFVSGLSRSDFRMFPFNRRHLWRGVYMPSLGVPGPEHIIAAIDTSGSMDERTLARVLAELDRLRALAECRLTVIQCDARIQDIVSFEPWDLAQVDFSRMTMQGRGGTNFRPVFERIERDHHLQSPDALIYMSDGYGDFPRDAPLFPCLWIVPAHGYTSFPFGEVIRLSPTRRQ